MGTSLLDFMPDNGMPGSPSAIRQMMSLLQQPNEPAAQGGSPQVMPPGDYGQGQGGLLGPTPPFAGGKPPGMIDRIMGRFRPKAPAGYEGLLSTEEIQGARPGLLQSLIGTPDAPSSSDRYRGNLNNIVAMKQMAGQVAAQKQLQESRAAIAARYPEKPNESPQETIARLRSMFAAAVGAGDTEMAGKLGEVVKALGGERGGGDDLEWVDLGGEKALVRKSTGEVIRREKKTPPARDPNAPDALHDQRLYTRANQLNTAFTRDTKAIAAASDQYRTLMSNIAAARQGNPQAQIALIFAFMKTLDPGSVVRESEYATAANAAGVPERIRNQYNKVLAGAFLTPEQVDGFASQAKETAKGWKRKQESFQRTYRLRAKRRGVDPEDVIVDYFEGIEEPDTSAANMGGAVKNAIGGIR